MVHANGRNFSMKLTHFLTTRHNVNPPVVVDTMANESVETQAEDFGSASDPGRYILNAPYTIDNEKHCHDLSSHCHPIVII